MDLMAGEIPFNLISFPARRYMNLSHMSDIHPVLSVSVLFNRVFGPILLWNLPLKIRQHGIPQGLYRHFALASHIYSL